MDIEFVILIVIVVAGFIGLFWFLSRKPKKADQDDGAYLMLQNQLNDVKRTLDEKLGEGARHIQESSKQMHEQMRTQFGESAKIIKEVTEGLTKLDETNKQVIGFAGQLQSLQDVLQNPKRRGVLGEYYLETVLKNVLPPSAYKMQYTIGKDENGSDLIVDAAIIVQDKIIPVDSKFSLENYNRLAEERDDTTRARLERQFKQDLKNRIDETSKYIRPEFNTMDFAMMFIPSETIYYDLTINQVGAVKVNTEELIQYAAKKRVSVVSPNSFYAYLQVILQGLRQIEIQQNTELIQKRVGDLGRHLKSYEDFYSKLGNTLRTTVNHYNAGYKELGKIDKDILRISGETTGLEPMMLDRPDQNNDTD